MGLGAGKGEGKTKYEVKGDWRGCPSAREQCLSSWRSYRLRSRAGRMSNLVAGGFKRLLYLPGSASGVSLRASRRREC